MQQNDVNKVILTGRISNVFVINQKRIILTVKIMNNYPQIFCTDEQADYVLEHCKLHQQVSIRANIQSSYKQKLGRITTLFADEVIAIPNGQYVPPENTFTVAGTIKSVIHYTDSGITRIAMHTYTNRHSSTFVLSFYYPDRRLIDSFEKGEFVSFKGRVQTVKKSSPGGKAVYYENYVVEFPYDRAKVA